MDKLFQVLLIVIAVGVLAVVAYALVVGWALGLVASAADDPLESGRVCGRCRQTLAPNLGPNDRCPGCGIAPLPANDMKPEMEAWANGLLLLGAGAALIIAWQWTAGRSLDRQWIAYLAAPQVVLALSTRAVRISVRRTSFRLVCWPATAIGLALLIYCVNEPTADRFGVVIPNAVLGLVLLLLFGLLLRAAAYMDRKRVRTGL